MYCRSVASHGGAQTDGGNANKSGANAFLDGQDAIVADACNDGVGRTVTTREFEGPIQRANEQASQCEREQDMPLGHIGE